MRGSETPLHPSGGLPPTAQMSLALTPEIPSSVVCARLDGFGLATVVNWLPFQCVTAGGSSDVTPTPQTSPGPNAATPNRPTCVGVLTRLHAEPSKCSTTWPTVQTSFAESAEMAYSFAPYCEGTWGVVATRHAEPFQCSISGSGIWPQPWELM